MNVDITNIIGLVVAGLVVAYAENARQQRARMWKLLGQLDRRLLRMEIRTGVHVADDESADDQR